MRRSLQYIPPGGLTVTQLIIVNRVHTVELVVARLAPLPVRLDLVVQDFGVLVQVNDQLNEVVNDEFVPVEFDVIPFGLLSPNSKPRSSESLNFNSDIAR